MDYKTIRQLSRAFSVQDIMTEVSLLKRAQTLSDAKNLFSEYDIVTYPKKGKIEGFFKNDSEDKHNIETGFIVSEGTSLFDLPQLFCENYFYFVISANKIVGYVHYSDLNKPLVKIPFFAMFQAVERKLWDKIQNKISEDAIRTLFPNDTDNFLKQKKKAEKNNVDVGWVGIFSFPYILRLARHYGFTDLSDEEIKQLKEIRNKVAHSDHYLIKDTNDVKTLAESHDIFINLLKSSKS
ncbi:hypothetical protein BH10ACI1_BH10ACI1_25880 [soil metagenome]